jgi:hypothetical protein
MKTEVWFSKGQLMYGGRSFTACGETRDWTKDVSQRLKPDVFSIVYGPTKVVP